MVNTNMLYSEEEVKDIVKFAVAFHYKRDMIQLACASVRSSTEESMFNDLNDFYYKEREDLSASDELMEYITEELG